MRRGPVTTCLDRSWLRRHTAPVTDPADHVQPSRDCPEPVREYAGQAVAYVERAIGVPLEYDSDTLPVLDHYLRSVPAQRPATRDLIVTTAGAYFGEVIRRRLGGGWDLAAGDPAGWRLVLPSGLSFSPAGLVAAAIELDDVTDLDASFDVPPQLRPHLEDVLSRMAEVTVETFYSLCGRFDTLEHIQSVLLAIAAELAAEQN
jgi:hypothetical protein